MMARLPQHSDPVRVLADGTHLYPVKDDRDGEICGRPQDYTSPGYVVPSPVPPVRSWSRRMPGAIICSCPTIDTETVRAAVVSLQSRMQFGAIFSAIGIGDIAGHSTMSLIKTENNRPGAGHHCQLQLR
jgi:hypothetical protein